jgi:HlyD family secretion protein
MLARNARWVLVAAIGVALVAVIAWLFLPKPVEIEVAQAHIGPITESVADQGTARVREAYVVAAPVSGRLKRIGLKVGDRVRMGEVVARIDPVADVLDPRTQAEAEAAVLAASAAVGAASSERDRRAAEARRIEGDLARTRVLAGKGYASPQALDAAEAAARAANAAVRAAVAETAARRAELARARATLGPEVDGRSSVEVRTPASGYVTRVLQESSRTLSAGAPLIEIGDQTGLEAAIEFLSQDAVRVREGMAAEIFDWGGTGTIPAIVRRVEPQGFTKVSALGVEEQRALVLLQFNGRPEAWRNLRPGYRVWGRIFLRNEPKALKVPLGALVRANGGWAVFRVDAGRARLAPVKVGALTDQEAEVISGLASGDEVIVFPSDRIREGVSVRTSGGSRDPR